MCHVVFTLSTQIQKLQCMSVLKEDQLFSPLEYYNRNVENKKVDLNQVKFYWDDHINIILS